VCIKPETDQGNLHELINFVARGKKETPPSPPRRALPFYRGPRRAPAEDAGLLVGRERAHDAGREGAAHGPRRRDVRGAAARRLRQAHAAPDARRRWQVRGPPPAARPLPLGREGEDGAREGRKGEGGERAIHLRRRAASAAETRRTRQPAMRRAPAAGGARGAAAARRAVLCSLRRHRLCCVAAAGRQGCRLLRHGAKSALADVARLYLCLCSPLSTTRARASPTQAPFSFLSSTPPPRRRQRRRTPSGSAACCAETRRVTRSCASRRTTTSLTSGPACSSRRRRRRPRCRAPSAAARPSTSSRASRFRSSSSRTRRAPCGPRGRWPTTARRSCGAAPSTSRRMNTS